MIEKLEKVYEALKWFVTLTPQKSIIVLLLSLVIYFGWGNFDKSEQLEQIQQERNKTSIDCSEKIANANQACMNKLTMQADKFQEKYDAYRDRVELENIETTKSWKMKYEAVQNKLEETQEKQLKTDEILRQLTKKLK